MQVVEQMEWSKLLVKKKVGNDFIRISGIQSEFEMDYLKIITNQSFRRLQDKTQVFPLEKNDFIRTRLTHSLEVSYIGKLIVQKFGSYALKEERKDRFKVTEDELEMLADIVMSAGLIHDIGNPPFGHYGEKSIQEWFYKNKDKLNINGIELEEKYQKDFVNFDGNAQALRVVNRLTYTDNKNGLDLSMPLLNTLVKYPVSSEEMGIGNEFKKIGYFHSEADLYEIITKATGAKGKRHPLTYILEAADDIAYVAADIEDALKKKVFSGVHFLKVLKQHTEKSKVNIKEDISQLEKALENPIDELSEIHQWLMNVQASLIYSAAFRFGKDYKSIMEGNYLHKDLFHDTHHGEMIKILKKVSYECVFNDSQILKLELSGNTVITWLLDHFVPAAIKYDVIKDLDSTDKKLMSLISNSSKKTYQHCKDRGNELSEEEKLYHRILMVTDYISGMTDSYARDLYRELNGID